MGFARSFGFGGDSEQSFCMRSKKGPEFVAFGVNLQSSTFLWKELPVFMAYEYKWI